MVKVQVKGGTPEGCESLCRTCTRGHIITGFRAAEQELFCRTFYIEREIHFPVRECTFYVDRRLASKEDMEKIAWVLVTKSVGRSIGFLNPERFREIEALRLEPLAGTCTEKKQRE
jgi:hypothetical protein